MTTKPPIAVDLDGTLIRSDSLVESLIAAVKRDFTNLFKIPFWLLKGKLALKREAYVAGQLAPEALPVHDEFLLWLKEQKKSGHPLILATASVSEIAHGMGRRLGIFDDVIASGQGVNLKGRKKCLALVERYGSKKFIYCGNGAVDLDVWREAESAVVVNGSRKLVASASKLCPILKEFPAPKLSPMIVIKAIRVHQWAKNVLIFLPAILGHFLSPATIAHSVLAFLSFSMTASSIYLINDIMDLEADRAHPSKKNRPLAAGTMKLEQGLILSLMLAVCGVALGASLGSTFFAVLIGYLILTNWYSAQLKRIPIADVLVLAGLYSVRLIAGSAATGVTISTWLLSVSMFFFLSLAFMKRVSELKLVLHRHKNSSESRDVRVEDLSLHGRGYIVTDLSILTSMGAASGYLSVLVFALYITSSAVRSLYTRPEILWTVCPLLLFWMSRAWLITNRGRMHSDPVAFALTDRTSYLTVCAVGVIWLVSWLGMG